MSGSGRRRVGTVFAVAAVIVGALLGSGLTGPEPDALAADARDFDAGNLISDALFFDGQSMDSSGIQSFLLSKVPTCRSDYACLTTYRQTTPTMPADLYCGRYVGESNESAARIISKVGRACGISQKSLLVLLEKEQSLVTSASPTRTRFEKATGMGCPDTAACSSAYAGFFYQVYYGARQFQIYKANPGSFNHRAGQTNSVRYHPNSACGTKQVYIANQATAGLYNYTPYTPDAAALANLYGSGGACSSYGNRNFWRIHTDWFGLPNGGANLVRTEADATVYLISGGSKYSITNSRMLAAYRGFGSVGYVSGSKLDSYDAAGPASLVVRSPSGGIYLLDGDTIHPMSSCTVVAYYGGSCSGGYTQLTDAQVALFRRGETVRTYLSDRSGYRWVIRDGAKREVLDDRSLADASISGTFVTLRSSYTLPAIRTGVPIVRDSVYIRKRGSSDYWFYADDAVRTIGSYTASQLGVSARVAGSLAATSAARLPSSSERFDGVVSLDGAVKVVSTAGRVGWGPSAVPTAQTPVPVTEDFLSGYVSTRTVVDDGDMVAPLNSSSRYLVTGDAVRRLTSAEAVSSVYPGRTVPEPAPVPTILVKTSAGGPVYPVGALVSIDGSRSVHLLNGVDERIRIPSMAITRDAGIAGVLRLSSEDALRGYEAAPATLTWGLRCGGAIAFPAGGRLHRIPSALVADYALQPTELDPLLCAQLDFGDDATRFIRVGSRSIYLIEDGERRQVMSLARWREISAGSGFVDVSDAFAAQFPIGPAA